MVLTGLTCVKEEPPVESLSEMKAGDRTKLVGSSSAFVVDLNWRRVGAVIDCGRFGSLRKLLVVTALVFNSSFEGQEKQRGERFTRAHHQRYQSSERTVGSRHSK